jgi:hypothetical protein
LTICNEYKKWKIRISGDLLSQANSDQHGIAGAFRAHRQMILLFKNRFCGHRYDNTIYDPLQPEGQILVWLALPDGLSSGSGKQEYLLADR